MAGLITTQAMTPEARQEAARLLSPYRLLILMAKERCFHFENIVLPDGKCVPIVEAILSCLRGVKEGLLTPEGEASHLVTARLRRLEQIRVILAGDPYFEPEKPS